MAIFMTPRQVAERWSCSARHVRRACASGALPAMRVGTDWRISVAAVEAHEAAHTPSAETVQPAQAARPLGVSTATHLGPLPDGYEPVFPDLWGMEPTTPPAAPSAAGRGRSTGQRKSAARG